MKVSSLENGSSTPYYNACAGFRVFIVNSKASKNIGAIVLPFQTASFCGFGTENVETLCMVFDRG